MPAIKQDKLYGWGNVSGADCQAYRPEKTRDLQHIVRGAPGPMIARGMGRSYGDASLCADSTILTERLDHFIEFDAHKGIVRAQAGVTLDELMTLSIPRGWLPPVVPGTSQVSLGGAFACNVHGKNHWREGEFAEHVLAIRLLMADGAIVECTPTENADLFWATAGGMGMTGIIEELTLQLRPIASMSLKTTTYRVSDIDDMLAAFEQARGSADYMIGWIDHMASGVDIGRGVFEAANHMLAGDGGLSVTGYRPPKTKLAVPFFLPPLVLNRLNMALYNRWRFKKYTAQPKHEVVDFGGFFHPLDRIQNWNRLYGKRGFFQYQCLLPEDEHIASRIRGLLETIQKNHCFSFLAVIKYHREGKGPLTFSKQGYSIALDFPNNRRDRDLLPQLDEWVAQQGGRVYLAKDSLLTPERFSEMYGEEARHWQEFLHDLDPQSRFISLMAQRLGWKQAA